MTTTTISSESAVRARARRAGFMVHKSRRSVDGLDNRGEFMLVDINKNYAVLGARYDATLEEIAEYLE